VSFDSEILCWCPEEFSGEYCELAAPGRYFFAFSSYIFLLLLYILKISNNDIALALCHRDMDQK